MSATEELRRLLDERGVEWDYGITGSTTTRFSVNGIDLTFTPMRDGLVCSTILTPEQAVAATLGSSNCTNDCTNSERTGACLPYWWTHDGTLHVELPKLPESISVRLPDQRDREVGSARVWQYTRDSGTCRDEGGTGANGEQVFNCSECGCVLSLYDRDGSNNLCTSFVFDYPRYCPECGRRIEVDR